jgi:flagellar hook-associated protein 2
MSVSSSLGSSSSAPISFTGLASGLNTNAIITDLLEADQVPITNLQNEITAATAQQGVYTQLQNLVQSFQQASAALDTPSAFDTVQAGSSNTAVATISTDGTSLSGSYNLTVNQLAQAEKVSSNAQAGTSNSLDLSGTIVINGKSLAVSDSDSLTTIAQGINGLNAGVTASLVNGGTNNSFLTLTATNTGTDSAVQMADMSGSVLSSLGFTSGTAAIADPITDGAASYGLSSGTAALQSLLGGETSGAIQVNGTSVNVDFATDSLQTIANNINSNVSGVNASVQAVTNNGATTYQLQITGSSGTPTFTDSNGVLASIGVLQVPPTNELISAQNAEYSLDNVNLVGQTNTDTTSIPGATLSLLQGTKASPGTSTLSLTQNTSGVVSNLQGFVSAFNAVNDFINSESTFNASSFATGPLFGDPVADQIQSQLSQVVFNNVAGNGSYSNLSSLGFSMNSSGDLSLNTSTVSSVLSSDPQAVANLFEATGQGSNSNLSYVTANSSTVPSTSGPYAVNITQLPTTASYTAATAQTQAATNAETLTFGGPLFNSTSVSLILNIGATLAQSVQQINNDPQLNTQITASVNGSGELQINSKRYGSIGDFTVTSNAAAGSGTSGIGTANAGTMTAGIDIAGTINGEAATGQGQFLTGTSGNPNTSGLELQYTGTSTGLVGTMSYSSGIGNQLSNMATTFSNATNGLIADENNSITQQIAGYNTDITTLQTQMTLEQQNLTEQFQNMENMIAQLQQQASSLTALDDAASGTTSSSSSSSSGTADSAANTGTSNDTNSSSGSSSS